MVGLKEILDVSVEDSRLFEDFPRETLQGPLRPSRRLFNERWSDPGRDIQLLVVIFVLFLCLLTILLDGVLEYTAVQSVLVLRREGIL